MKERLGATLNGLKGKASGLARSIRGAAAIEFALMSTVIMIILVGVADYGMVVFDKMEVRSAARAGSQYALAYAANTGSITSTVEDAIKQTVADSTNLSITTADVTLECSCLDTSTGLTVLDICVSNTCASGEGFVMKVNVAYTHTLLISIPGFPSTITLSDESLVRLN